MTALLRVFNDLLPSSDSDHISVSTLLDLNAAFDTIDHDLLLNLLRYVFGIRDSALVFFGSDIIEHHSSSCPHSLYLISLNITLHPVHTASI